MRVLGIDPGYAIVGWGVVEYISNRFAPIGYGAVITEKDTPFEQRLVEIYESVFDICKRYQPEALSIEKLYYQHNQTTVIGVAEARGVILLAAAQCGVPIYEYTPMQVKQAITGYGKAVKKQIQEMTRIMLLLESRRYRRRPRHGDCPLPLQPQPVDGDTGEIIPCLPPSGGRLSTIQKKDTP